MESDVVTGPQGVRVRVLLVVAVVTTGLAWLVLKLLAGTGRGLPESSWLGIVIFVAIGLGIVVVGRPVRRLLAGTATRPVHPLYAARVLAMAQAAALAGAVILGWYVAQILLVLPDSDVASQQQQVLKLGLLALSAAGLSGVGLLVQRWCRLDDEQDRDPSDPRFGGDGGGRRGQGGRGDRGLGGDGRRAGDGRGRRQGRDGYR